MTAPNLMDVQSRFRSHMPIAAWLNEAAEEGDVPWQNWSQQVERTRLAAANLVGAGVEEIALVPNTTSGISLVAEGFPWREGDNVVTLDNEFPSNLYPWLNLASRGVETRKVPVEPRTEARGIRHAALSRLSGDTSLPKQYERDHDRSFFCVGTGMPGIFTLTAPR